jgi:hypothetical protein
VPRPAPRIIVSWILQVLSAGILLQTLFFKFTGAAESKFIFETLGAEPWGRIGSGVAELVVAVLLLTPRTIVFGAAGAVGVITGAIGAHFTKLGIVVQNDGGLLFGLACTVFVCGLAILAIRRDEAVALARRFGILKPLAST